MNLTSIKRIHTKMISNKQKNGLGIGHFSFVTWCVVTSALSDS